MKEDEPHPLDIPAFLRIPQEERRRAWKEHQPNKSLPKRKPSDIHVPKGGIEPSGRALLKELERQREQAKAQRLADLKERKAATKRGRLRKST